MKLVDIFLLLHCLWCSRAATRDYRPRILTTQGRARDFPGLGVRHSQLQTKPRSTRDAQRDEFDLHASAQNHALAFASPPLGGGDSAFSLGPSSSVFGALPSYANGRGLTYNGPINGGANSFLPNFDFPNFGSFPQFGNGSPGRAQAYIPPVSKVLKEGINAFVPAGAQKYANPAPVPNPAVSLPQQTSLPLPQKPPTIRFPSPQKGGGNSNQFDVFRQVAVNPLQKAFSASISDPSLSPLPFPEKDSSKEETIQLIKRVEQDLLNVEKSLTPEERKTKEIYEAIDGIGPATKLVKEVAAAPAPTEAKIYAAKAGGQQKIEVPENYVSHNGFPIQSDSKLSPFQPPPPASSSAQNYAENVEHRLEGPAQSHTSSITAPSKIPVNFQQKEVTNPENYFEEPIHSKPNIKLESEAFIRPGSNRGEFYPLTRPEEIVPHRSTKTSEPVDALPYENLNARTFRQEPHISKTSRAGARKPNDGISLYASPEQASPSSERKKELQPIEYKQFAYDDDIHSPDLDPHSKVLQSFGLRPLPKPPQVEPPELLSGPELLTLVQKSNPAAQAIPAEKLLAIASTTINSIESLAPTVGHSSDYQRTSPSPERNFPPALHRGLKNSSAEGFQRSPFTGEGGRISSPSVPYRSPPPSYTQGTYLNHQVSENVKTHEIPTNVSHTKVLSHDNPQTSRKVPFNSYNYAPEYPVRTHVDSLKFSGINETFITPTDSTRGSLARPPAGENLQSTKERLTQPRGEHLIGSPEAGIPHLHGARSTQQPRHIFKDLHASNTPLQSGRKILTQTPEGKISGLIRPQGKRLNQPLADAKAYAADLDISHITQPTFERPPLQRSEESERLFDGKNRNEPNIQLTVPQQHEASHLGSNVLAQTNLSHGNTRSNPARVNTKVDPDYSVGETDITSYLFPRQEHNGRLTSAPESVIRDFNFKTNIHPISVVKHKEGFEVESQVDRPVQDYQYHGTVLRFNSTGHSKNEFSFNTETPSIVHKYESGNDFSIRSHEKNKAQTYDFTQRENIDKQSPRNPEVFGEHSSLRNIHDTKTENHEFNHDGNVDFPNPYKKYEKSIDSRHESAFPNPALTAHQLSLEVKVSPGIPKHQLSADPLPFPHGESTSFFKESKNTAAVTRSLLEEETAHELYEGNYGVRTPDHNSYEEDELKYAKTKYGSHKEEYSEDYTKHSEHDFTGENITSKPPDHALYDLDDKHTAAATQYALQNYNSGEYSGRPAPNQQPLLYVDQETHTISPTQTRKHGSGNFKREKLAALPARVPPNLSSRKSSIPHPPYLYDSREQQYVKTGSPPLTVNDRKPTTAAPQSLYVFDAKKHQVGARIREPPSSKTVKHLGSTGLLGVDVNHDDSFTTSLEKPSTFLYTQHTDFSDQGHKQRVAGTGPGEKGVPGSGPGGKAFSGSGPGGRDVAGSDPGTHHLLHSSFSDSLSPPSSFKNEYSVSPDIDHLDHRLHSSFSDSSSSFKSEHSASPDTDNLEHGPSVNILGSLRNVQDFEDSFHQYSSNHAQRPPSVELEPYFSTGDPSHEG